MRPPDQIAALTRAVQAAEAAGLCVVPPRQDGSKQPDVPIWSRYQRHRPSPSELADWYGSGRRTGIGLICGAVSGHLELFEFDDRLIYERFLAAAQEAGLGPLVARIRTGYEEVTPGEGVHWFVIVLGGGAKTEALARRMGLDKHGRPCPIPLIETKGEGGYAVVAPSFGRVHPSGKAYVLASGGFASIATITPEERDALWSLARTFDELPQSPPREEQAKTESKWEVRPGDDFNARAAWRDLLVDAGWEAVREHGETTYWHRPGGYEGGWGASTNHGGTDLLHLFTTAAPPLKADTNYTKFGCYAALNHDGNFAAAAAALEAQGYGKRRPSTESTNSTASSPNSSSAPPAPLVPVMPFPVDALPPVARAFVLAGAKALGCPPDFVALPLFAFIGAVAGNSRKLRLKHRFLVAPIFWIGVIGKPGAAKTPALDLGRGLVDLLQKASWERYQAQLAAWQEESPKERGAQPRPEHFFATDTTVEAIAFALQKSKGLTIIHDELVGWVSGFDAYRKGGDRQAWLSLWSGQPLKPNRKTGEQIYIVDPVVCVTGGIQPDVLHQLAGEAARNDGFLPRFLLGWPDAEPSGWSEAVVSDAIMNALAAVVLRLRAAQGEPVLTSLSDEAKAEFVAWYDENVRLTGAASGLAAGWGAKAPVHLARIALVLHLLQHEGRPGARLSVATLRGAIAIVEYFRDHLRRVLPAFGSPPPVIGAGLGARIRRVLAAAQPEWLGRAELAIRLGGHDPSPAIDAVLAALEDSGQAERRTVATSGRPRIEWRWIAGDQHRDDATGAEDGGDQHGDEEPSPEHSEPRDYVERREKGPDGGFPRNHVTTHDEAVSNEPEPDESWETWEEGL